MTTRIYITGDVGDVSRMEIYDADTGKQLVSVKQADIVCTCSKTMADLHMLNGSVIHVDVVPAPVRVNVRNREAFLDLVRRQQKCSTCQGAGELVDFNIRKPCPDCNP